MFFLNNYICDNVVLDKIDKRVYNVIRDTQGAFTSIGYVDLQPPRGYFGCFNKNIARIYSPKIWPQGGLRGLWVFSGNWVYLSPYSGVSPCLPLELSRVNQAKQSQSKISIGWGLVFLWGVLSDYQVFSK